MAVQSINETNKYSGLEKGIGDRYYTRSFVAAMDPEGGPYPSNLAERQIKTALESVQGAVRIGYPHPSDPFYICSNIEVRPVSGSNILFEATARYQSRNVLNTLTENQLENALLRPPIVNIRYMTVVVPAEKDMDGITINNTANVPYDPPIEITRIYPILQVQQNEEFTTIAAMFTKMRTYCGTINSIPFRGAPEKTLKAMIDVNLVIETIQYWQVTYELIYREEGWDTDGKILSTGYMEWIGDESIPDKKHLVPITFPKQVYSGGVPTEESKQLSPISQPWFLGNGGIALTYDEAYNPNNHVYDEYKAYRETNFDNMNINIPN